MRGGIPLAGIAFLLVGAVSLEVFPYLYLRDKKRAEAALRWPTTDATVAWSSVEARRTPKGTWYRPSVQCESVVAGIICRGNRVRFGTMFTPTPGPATALVERYASGLIGPIHHDPSNPSKSVREPGGVNQRFLNVSLIGLLFIGFGLFAFVKGA